MVISTFPHQEIKELTVGGHFLPRLGDTGENIIFIHLETKGVIDMTSAIDKECLWVFFSKIIKQDFYVLKDHWNSQRIRKSGFETIPRRPNVLYYLPDISRGATDLKLHVSD